MCLLHCNPSRFPLQNTTLHILCSKYTLISRLHFIGQHLLHFLLAKQDSPNESRIALSANCIEHTILFVSYFQQQMQQNWFYQSWSLSFGASNFLHYNVLFVVLHMTVGKSTEIFSQWGLTMHKQWMPKEINDNSLLIFAHTIFVWSSSMAKMCWGKVFLHVHNRFATTYLQY